MATKEERDRRRQERLAAEQRELAAARRRLIFGYVTAGLLAGAVVIGLVIVVLSGGDDGGQVDGRDVPEAAHVQLKTGSLNDIPFDDRPGTPPPGLTQGDLEAAADAAGCDLALDLSDEGNTHIKPSDPVPDYETSPPTSGNHIQPPLQQADGAYREYPGSEYVVHSLEHGRIAIQYSPDLPEKDQLALKGVFDEDAPGVLFFPNPDMPYDVAATAWTQLLGCPKFEGQATLDAIRNFRDIYRGQGPEPVAIVIPND
jgi:hypothetical protein